MSIIYDALKKIERNKPKITADKQKTTPRIYGYLVYLIVALLGFVLADFTFNIFNQKFLKKGNALESGPKEITVKPKEEKFLLPPQEETVSKPLIKSEKDHSEILKLNGIFYDIFNPYVLINNRILKKGDCFKDYCIKDIFPDKVQLEFKGEIIELKI